MVRGVTRDEEEDDEEDEDGKNPMSWRKRVSISSVKFHRVVMSNMYSNGAASGSWSGVVGLIGRTLWKEQRTEEEEGGVSRSCVRAGALQGGGDVWVVSFVKVGLVQGVLFEGARTEEQGGLGWEENRRLAAFHLHAAG